ncbi:hypothetical protein CROQUDRAFT_658035 [Cronartium quercuum f. sp. fusiforme G11]|uniref:Uncharacterized protein n=1 Tax=Cronartium quercuum f. sp. fusiforme G11 TaxID=708437 RepID=A0A9P6NLV9_9BASI|nr:hypothetical protein CROQUDRAFT_658035 [Cronartium quercuum f. sp. fusiforme G11]
MRYLEVDKNDGMVYINNCQAGPVNSIPQRSFKSIVNVIYLNLNRKDMISRILRAR